MKRELLSVLEERMSKLSKLLGNPVDVEIGGEIFTLKPLTVKNMDLIMALEDERRKAGALKEIIRLTLKEAVPDASDEELEGVSFTHFKALTDAILVVNGLDESKKES